MSATIRRIAREELRKAAEPRLARGMGLAGLTATGVCSMVGAGINEIPFMIQRNVLGIGPLVLLHRRWFAKYAIESYI